MEALIRKQEDVTPRYVIVMGVSGTGKTTIGEALARSMDWPFQEGDALHPPANVEKMRTGHPLNDEDRAPWLKLCRDWLEMQFEAGRGGVLTCSALKRKYREQLSAGLPVQFIYLKTSQKTIEGRLEHRTGHYMPPSLLPSQFATLEEPKEGEEPVIIVPGEVTPQELMDIIIKRLRASKMPTDY